MLTTTTAETALTRQQAITKQLEGEYQALLDEFSQMSAHYLRMGWHKGFSDYHAQRREVNAKIVYKQADLQRSRLKEAALVRAMERAGLVAA